LTAAAVVLDSNQVLAIMLADQLDKGHLDTEDMCYLASTCTAIRDWLASRDGLGARCCISLQSTDPAYVKSLTRWLAKFGHNFITMSIDAEVMAAMQLRGLLDNSLQECSTQLGEAIVSSSTALRSLTLTSMPFDAQHVAQLTCLQNLEVTNAGAAHLAALPSLTSLTGLTLFDSKADEEPSLLPPPQQLDLLLPVSVQRLELTGFPVAEIQLPKLTHLKFAAPHGHVYNVPDLVGPLSSLQHLDLSDTGGGTTPMELLVNMPGLTELRMVLDVTASVAPLADLQQLQVLEVVRLESNGVCSAASICNVLTGLPLLHSLYLHGVGLRDRADALAIAGLTGLTSLWLQAPVVSEACLLELFALPGALPAVSRLSMVSWHTGIAISRDVVRQLCVPGGLPSLSYFFVNMALSALPVDILLNTFWVMRPDVLVETI
jgi:hypothetical protein